MTSAVNAAELVVFMLALALVAEIMDTISNVFKDHVDISRRLVRGKWNPSISGQTTDWNKV